VLLMEKQTESGSEQPMMRQNAMSLMVLSPPVESHYSVQYFHEVKVGSIINDKRVEKYPYPETILDGWEALIPTERKSLIFSAAEKSGRYDALVWGAFASDDSPRNTLRNVILFRFLSDKNCQILFKPSIKTASTLVMIPGAEAKINERDVRSAISGAKLCGEYHAAVWKKVISKKDSKVPRSILFDATKDEVLPKLKANSEWEKTYGKIHLDQSVGCLKQFEYPKKSGDARTDAKALSEWQARYYECSGRMEQRKRDQLDVMIRSGVYIVSSRELHDA
jgi:hypothetical protein